MTQYIPQILLTIIPAVLVYLFTKRKQDVDVEKAEAEIEHIETTTIKEVAELWKATAIEFKKEVAELRVIVDELKKENKELKKEINNLKVSYK